jgi:hypothetical protein
MFAGASAGHDASMRPFADGSVEKLAEACRRFLINPGKDRDLRKWAAEGNGLLTRICQCSAQRIVQCDQAVGNG